MQSLKPDPNARYRNLFHALKCIVKREGLLAPLRGMNVVAIGAGPAHALYFGSYEYVKKKLKGNNKSYNPLSYGKLLECQETVTEESGS
jgi:solute carrier family 25 iron transporter 28/37